MMKQITLRLLIILSLLISPLAPLFSSPIARADIWGDMADRGKSVVNEVITKPAKSVRGIVMKLLGVEQTIDQTEESINAIIDKAKLAGVEVVETGGIEARKTLRAARIQTSTLIDHLSQTYQANLDITVASVDRLISGQLEKVLEVAQVLNDTLLMDLKVLNSYVEQDIMLISDELNSLLGNMNAALKERIEQLGTEVRLTVDKIEESLKEVVIVSTISGVYLLSQAADFTIVIMSIIFWGVGLLMLIWLLFTRTVIRNLWVRRLLFSLASVFFIFFGTLLLWNDSRAFVLTSAQVGLRQQLMLNEKPEIDDIKFIRGDEQNSLHMEISGLHLQTDASHPTIAIDNVSYPVTDVFYETINSVRYQIIQVDISPLAKTDPPSINILINWSSGESERIRLSADTTTPLVKSSSIATGQSHTCVLTTEGRVKCWGQNDDGQLGDGTQGDAYSRRLSPVDVSGLSANIQAIAAGWLHTCALNSEKNLKCWGRNLYGQLGDGTQGDENNSRLTPIDVIGLSSNVQSIAAGAYHTCVVTFEGSVKCWGDSPRGELGDGTQGDEKNHRLTPVDVIGLSSGVQAISAGVGHTCALTVSGSVKCWGDNRYGAVGDGTQGDENNNRLTPVDVIGLSFGVKAISAGGFHTCALTNNGGVKCWGLNRDGQIGVGSQVDENPRLYAPVDVIGLSSGIKAISAGGFHTCALTDKGGIKCWGGNLYGQLGDGTIGDEKNHRLTPVDVIGLSSKVQFIASGKYHTCALTIWCCFVHNIVCPQSSKLAMLAFNNCINMVGA